MSFFEQGSGQIQITFLCYLLIPIIVGIISMLALNPCVVSYDAYEVIAEAKGLTSIQDYAGVPYVLWFRLWLSIYDSVEILCFIQIILYALVFGIFFLYLEKRFQVNHRFLFVIYLLFSLLPNNVMMLITLSKDVYYAIALLVMTIAFMRLTDSENIKNYILLSFSMIFVWSIRQSGILTVMIVTILAVVFLKKKKSIMLFASISIFAALIINLGLFKATEADPVQGGMKYIALYQDILGVYYNGGDLSENTHELVKKGVGDNPEFDEKYTPYWAYYDYYYPELEDQNVTEFVFSYVDTFVRNPILMSRAILCRLDMLWDIKPGFDAFESWQWRVDNTGGRWTYLVKPRTENVLTNLINFYGEKSKELPYKNIVWRVAVLNLLVILQLLGICDRKGIIALLPFIGYGVSYMISLGWSHYRYYWADELLMFALCLYFVFFRNSEDGNWGK